MKVRVADYIASRLLELGAEKVFIVNGGGMMHLVDTLGRPNGLDYVCNHHEQASAMAADGYARRAARLGVCYATSGPGATNLLTGIAGAYQDSTPILFITGQSKSTQTIRGSGIEGLRQFGTFEVDIVPIVKPVTKYAEMVLDPSTVRFHLEKALHLATTGRPGPALLDMPLDVQGALIDPDEQLGYTPKAITQPVPAGSIESVAQLLAKSKRPLILAGYGIRCAGAVAAFQLLVEESQIPVVTTQLGKDALYYDHPLFVGHPGPKGDRPGNFAVQTADLILSIGSSLHAQTTGWESELFAPRADRVRVDIDVAVLQRETDKADHVIQAGCLEFIEALRAARPKCAISPAWPASCESWKSRYAVRAEAHERSEQAYNFYEFVEALSDVSPADSCFLADAGSAFYVMGTALRLKNGQRFISSGSLGAMGFALPAANGAACTADAGPVICVTGDGSLMTNVHDLATMSKYRLNVKLFVVNNDGYVSMRNTQREFFSGHYVGADHHSGVFIPDMQSFAISYDLPFVRCTREDDLKAKIAEVIAMDGPILCEVVAMRDQKIIPAVQSVRLANGKMRSAALHEMFPHLPADVLESELNNAVSSAS